MASAKLWSCMNRDISLFDGPNFSMPQFTKTLHCAQARFTPLNRAKLRSSALKCARDKKKKESVRRFLRFTFNVNESDSLGLQIVNNLVEQINGTIELKRNMGSEFIIRFEESGKTKLRY